MEQVVSDSFTVSNLSTFESGKSKLTLEKFYYIIERISLKMEEFEYAKNGYQLNDFYRMIQEIRKFYTTNNIQGLKKLMLGKERKYFQS